MRRSLCRVIGLVCPLLAPCAVQAQVETPRPVHRWADGGHQHTPGCETITGCGKGDFFRAMASAGIEEEDPVGACLAREALTDTDLLHCDLELEIIISPQTIIGRNTFTLKSNIADLTEFTFRLRNNYTITAALINGSTPVAVATPTTTTRIATLDRAYSTGEVFTLTIEYAGPPVSRGFGSINFDTFAGNPVVSTLSQPYFAYTWWPAKDGDFGMAGDTSDKFTLDIAIIAPAAMRSVANGVLQGIDDLANNRRRHRWASQYPIATYLVAFSSSVYNTHDYIYTHPGGAMPVEFNLYPSEDTPANRAAWEKSIDMLAAFRPIFGEYPFIDEGYGIYHFPFNGGMEHQTNSGQGGYAEWLTAHELAHQWWGNDITTKTWHDIWLNEGFATYGEALWLERRPGSSGLPALQAAMNARRPTSVNGTVHVADVTNLNRIFSSNFSYRKGAWVLHQLRKVLGDEKFFDTLQMYRSMYTGSSATTDDFEAVASAVYGDDLSWFFDQWIYMPGAPAYNFGYDSVVINGQDYLKLHIRQTQQTSYGLYRMPVDVRIDTAQGSAVRTIWNWAPLQHYMIAIGAPATLVTLDEFDWILATSKTSEAYQIGPPKVVSAAPSPGDEIAVSAAPQAVVITFSEAVVAQAGDFALTTPAGPVAFSFDYAAALFQATLTPAEPLAAGMYTVRVRDTVTSVAAGLALDGALAVPDDPALLPSGNGLPGGDAVFSFEIKGGGGADCYANCDGSITHPILNVEDFICFINEFGEAANLPHAQQITHYANCDGSTIAPVLNVDDFVCFINEFATGAGCR
jgi:aminopeptidase N